MSTTRHLNLLDFVIENKGEDAFVGLEKEEIAAILKRHIFEDTILCVKDKDLNYTGVLIWTYESWIPISIYVNQIVGKGQAGILLKKLRERLPPSFHIWANRKNGKKKIIYKKPERIIQYMLRQDSKKKGIS